MKAIVYTKYGSPDVLELKDVEKPAPNEDEVLIKVFAASVNPAELHLLRADPFIARLYSGLLKPKNTILGADIAGRVESVGRNIKQFHIGDEVFGDLSDCGWGGFAQYVCAPENALALKPVNLSFGETAAVPDRKSTRLNSSHLGISYAVFCLKKKIISRALCERDWSGRGLLCPCRRALSL